MARSSRSTNSSGTRARANARTSRKRSSSAGQGIPPVMVRGGVTEFPSRPIRRSNAKRRFDVSLPIAGAEMRLPSLPRVRIGWRLLSLALTIFFGFLLYQFWNSPAYKVQAAEVEGLKRLSSTEVNAVLNLSDEPIYAVDVAAAQDRLEKAFPEFSEVSVAVALPNKVTVSLSERQPVLVWQQDGRTMLVDQSGVAFPVRGESVPEGLPVVAAQDTSQSILPMVLSAEAYTSLEAAQAAQQAAQAAASSLLSDKMVAAVLALAKDAPANTPLVYDNQRGLGWQDERGWKVYFGDAQDIKMKINVYNAMVAQLSAQDIQPSLISVEFVHSPYYRVN
jgi:cell division septal protein FtsQ